jgi:two-component system sensor histidine kinase KdpD
MEETGKRPDPDELLARVKEEEVQRTRGRLKIFLGYVAGVGKTYSMLEAARQRKAEGVDVVAGYVETHGRPETEALAEGLEAVPRRQTRIRGVAVDEMDLDAVLARKPQLALVDELAHTNAPGSRHPKRYADVQELLDAGIDVYTTLNVQHLESLKDIVAQITGVVVREAVPDSFLDEASEIELIDLPPDELLKRLREGKVYVPEQAQRAMAKFFRRGNLTALREIAMRSAADRVDDQMREYMRREAIIGPWPAGERLLVCVSASPLGERLIRAGRRLADELGAEWHAVYVQTPGPRQSSQAVRNRGLANLHLAEQLGAVVRNLQAETVADGVLTYARAQNMTKIIVGKPLRSRVAELVRGSMVDRIIRQSGPIDVYVISGSQEEMTPASLRTEPARAGFMGYLRAAVLVAVATALSLPLRDRVEPVNLVMVYLASVVISGIYLGYGPSVLASLAGVLAFDFFCILPYYSFSVNDKQYAITFAGLLGVGLIVSALASRLRARADISRRREGEATRLYAMSREMNTAVGREAIAAVLERSVRETFGCEALVLVPAPGDAGKLVPGRPESLMLPETEAAVAYWSFSRGEQAGFGTETLPESAWCYIPLKAQTGVVGVLASRLSQRDVKMSPEDRLLIDAFASVAALAIERSNLARQAAEVRLLKAREELQAALLNSVSHDLRTPLTTIVGALYSLADDERLRRLNQGGLAPLDPADRAELIEVAKEEADRLSVLVKNLLDMSRLDAGALRMNRQPHEVQDIIGSALSQLKDKTGDRAITIMAPENLPLVEVDFTLLVQSLVNLLDNAIKYSRLGSKIDIEARRGRGDLQISVSDRGVGIPKEDLGRVFDKFYRVERHDRVPGTGLGLSISKGFVEAHGGRIWAENREGGGTTVTISLPLPGPVGPRQP